MSAADLFDRWHRRDARYRARRYTLSREELGAAVTYRRAEIADLPPDQREVAQRALLLFFESRGGFRAT